MHGGYGLVLIPCEGQKFTILRNLHIACGTVAWNLRDLNWRATFYRNPENSLGRTCIFIKDELAVRRTRGGIWTSSCQARQVHSIAVEPDKTRSAFLPDESNHQRSTPSNMPDGQLGE